MDSQGNELTEAQQRRYKHVAPELRDEEGKIKPFYHGTARADRVGYVFDPKRATSGPMAYFTDVPDIATNYSRDKEILLSPMIAIMTATRPSSR